MEIEEKENQILVKVDTFEGYLDFFTNAFRGLFFLGVVLFLVATQETGAGKYILFVVLLILGWEIISAFWGNDEAYHGVIDKGSGTITITTRTPATLWIPNNHKFKIDKVKSIGYGNYDETEKRVRFNFKSGEQIVFVGIATAKVAEKISYHLRAPLQIELGDESITHIPWEIDSASEIIPTPCTSCGAPLPKIEPNTRNVKCTHCGMTMVIQWQDGKLSYKKADELGF